MVDVVANHMASGDSAETVDYSILNPFNEQQYFHGICWVTDYNNQTNVELVSTYGPGIVFSHYL
jgi:alpha-amylase